MATLTRLKKAGAKLRQNGRLDARHGRADETPRESEERYLRDFAERKEAEEAMQGPREELEGRVERQMLRRNPYGLTFRELTVLHLVSSGMPDKGIGMELGISPLTAQKHISNILFKMEASCRTEACVRAVREGLLE